MITRRQAIWNTALLATAAACRPFHALAADAAPAGPFKLPPLPYAFDALEPYIDAKTMEIHHDRHHATYVANLNKAVVGHDALAKKPVEQIVRHLDEVPESIRTVVRNSAGGHFNHTLFWQMMKQNGGGQPKGSLSTALNRNFGSFDKFKEEFTAAATKVFGSGWAWLILDGKELKIASTPNQDAPVLNDQLPLLGIDVWEHAYYLKYQNKRADYIAAFYNVINWDFVAERYQRAAG